MGSESGMAVERSREVSVDLAPSDAHKIRGRDSPSLDVRSSIVLRGLTIRFGSMLFDLINGSFFGKL